MSTTRTVAVDIDGSPTRVAYVLNSRLLRTLKALRIVPKTVAALTWDGDTVLCRETPTKDTVAHEAIHIAQADGRGAASWLVHYKRNSEDFEQAAWAGAAQVVAGTHHRVHIDAAILAGFP